MTTFCRDQMILLRQTLLPLMIIRPGSHGGHWPIALKMPLLQHTRHLVCVVPLMNHGDRKSTRLNSSHVSISYAVFCLKKKRCGRRDCSTWCCQGCVRSLPRGRVDGY